mmetsp:Transcript_54914/g.102862  ORF Transcript_54914/g.102862 Transcript_54914/m.102862 type:complete len:270 (-) Transcript_54914:193-1002(-)
MHLQGELHDRLPKFFHDCPALVRCANIQQLLHDRTARGIASKHLHLRQQCFKDFSSLSSVGRLQLRLQELAPLRVLGHLRHMAQDVSQQDLTLGTFTADLCQSIQNSRVAQQFAYGHGSNVSQSIHVVLLPLATPTSLLALQRHFDSSIHSRRGANLWRDLSPSRRSRTSPWHGNRHRAHRRPGRQDAAAHHALVQWVNPREQGLHSRDGRHARSGWSLHGHGRVDHAAGEEVRQGSALRRCLRLAKRLLEQQSLDRLLVLRVEQLLLQ